MALSQVSVEGIRLILHVPKADTSPPASVGDLSRQWQTYQPPAYSG